MMNIPVISGLISLGQTWLEGRTELKKAEDKAKADIILKSADNVADWERIQAKNAESSLKDEWFAITFSIPLWGCFIPSMAPYVAEGFKVLEATPEWYRWLLGVIVCASFGIKKLDNFITKRRVS